MIFPAPKPITLGRASLMMGFGAVKIAGAVLIHWRASTHPTGLEAVYRYAEYNDKKVSDKAVFGRGKISESHPEGEDMNL
ncbi:MAG: hypothetical protein GY862_01710 [Gammaproteobacteria bacterium]|nr:hypothetical protein [Gammaproteobacteria bacterium]